jgi:hypothetical protein
MHNLFGRVYWQRIAKKIASPRKTGKSKLVLKTYFYWKVYKQHIKIKIKYGSVV